MTKGEFPGAGLHNGIAPSIDVAFVEIRKIKLYPLKNIGKPFGIVLDDWLLGILWLIAPAVLEELQNTLEVLQGFLGLSGFCRKMNNNYCRISRALHPFNQFSDG